MMKSRGLDPDPRASMTFGLPGSVIIYNGSEYFLFSELRYYGFKLILQSLMFYFLPLIPTTTD
jgi:hypothetical protein